MNKLGGKISSITILAFAMPLLASAQSAQQRAAEEAADFVATFNEIILYPTIALLTVVAFLVFLWGCAEYFFGAANEQARQQGVKHVTFGIIGLVIMVSAFSILTIFANTFGLNKQLDCAKDPTQPDCKDVFMLPSNSGGGPGGGAPTGGGPGGGAPTGGGPGGGAPTGGGPGGGAPG